MTNFEHYKDKLTEWVKEGSHCEKCPARNNCSSDGLAECSASLVTWGLKEYEPPKPKRHTMQEIADFFGKPFAKDEDEGLFVHKNNPEFGIDSWNSTGFFCIPRDYVSDCDSHDWTILVTPKESRE